ncbi:MAG: phosphoglucosamine mutase [Gammaproteobacteria bacterium]|nr:phosphoglucosamine mutase [Gammaproteobacteria bacterium]
MKRKYFGTDGIRGKVGEYPITPEFVLRLGWAAGKVLGQGGGKVLIGKDTRISGYMFESALEAGLSAAGVDIHLLGPMPTPAIAYLTRTMRARAGIVISASHNPFDDNGIKFFSAQGQKLPDEVEMAIEAELDKPMGAIDSACLGKAHRVVDADGRYIEFCKSTIPVGMQFTGLKVVVDCAHGATYHVTPNVFRELGAEVTVMGTEPDGLNINRACGSTHPEALIDKVKELGADLGIALDGDGDRVLLVDHKGELVDGDEILFIIASARQQREHAGLSGGVIGTLMSNLGLEHAFDELGIPFKRAAVGDRYVIELMQQEGWDLGGESSGHIICRDRVTTGDGTVSALQVVASMVETGRSLHELKQGMNKYPQTMINVRVARKVDPFEFDEISTAVHQQEARLEGRGRVLLRASGTEPVIRVMVEGQDADEVREAAQELSSIVENAISE